jgi:hypothetical protein
MNNKDRKAWLRIVEAFLAILIIFGAVLVILAKQDPKADIGEGVYERQRQILEIISKNDSLRSSIIAEDNSKVNAAISTMIPPSWNFAINICNLDNICPNPGSYENKDVYATEVVITSTLTQYSPKKLRFFVWSK